MDERKISFNQTLPADLVARVAKFCDDRGLKKWKLTATAIEFFLELPAGLRDQLLIGDPAAFAKALAPLMQSIESPTPEKAARKLLEMAKKASAPTRY